MKNKTRLLLPLLAIMIHLPLHSQGYHVRIGTIGNSITHGNMLASPSTQAYPAQLNEMLKDVFGDTCIVTNYGLTTTTMLKNGDVSYWDTQHLKNYLAAAPEICLIMLGTNDTKPQNWDVYGNEFIGDYLSMIDTIKQRNPLTKFIVAYPPPAFAVEWGIRDSVLVHGVMPAVDSVIKKVEDAVLMDFYHPLLDSISLFPDNIHPNVRGNTVMAKMLMDRIIETDLVHKAETGLTFITGFASSNSLLAEKKSAVLSWTSINSNTTTLNGEPVESSGSVVISPSETTVYTLVAEGDKSSDTVSLLQEVYVPELTRLRISPTRKYAQVRDSIYLRIYFHDQYDSEITSNSYDLEWSLTGSGSFTEESDSSVVFVCESPDTSYIHCSYNSILQVEAVIITRAISGVDAFARDQMKTVIYPNPATGFIHIAPVSEAGLVDVTIYDLLGRQRVRHTFSSTGENDVHTVPLENLGSGHYVLRVISPGGEHTERIQVLAP